MLYGRKYRENENIFLPDSTRHIFFNLFVAFLKYWTRTQVGMY